MKKYMVMGKEMVMLEDVCHMIRKLRKEIDAPYNMREEERKAGMREAYENIVRHIFIEEIRGAKNQDEIERILEMQGDFVVVRKDSGKKGLSYFGGWTDGKAMVTTRSSECMHFDYESMADLTAERLGEGWMVVDTCPAEYEDNIRMLRSVLGEI